MQDKFHGEELQVGDKVVVFATSYLSKRRYVGTIIKRTPTGLLDVEFNGGKTDRFKSDGNAYHRSIDSLYSTRYYLEDYTEERANEIERANWREKAIKYIKNKADFESLNDNDLRQILRMFGVK